MHGTAANLDAVWGGERQEGGAVGVSARATVPEEEGGRVAAEELRVMHDAMDALGAELAHRTGVFLVLLVACVFVLTQRIQQLEHRLRLREGVQPPHPWW